MLQNTLMLILYLFLLFYALRRITSWLRYSFSISKKKRRIIDVIICIIVAGTASTIMLWMPFPRNDLSKLIIRTGNLWLGFFIEFITVLALSDLILLIIRAVRRKRKSGALSSGFCRIYGLSVFIIALALTIIGFINARSIRINDYDITVSKKSSELNELDVVLIADTHMGYNIGCSQIKSMVEKINSVDPDAVIIAGDVFDNSFDSLDDPEELAALYRQIKSEYGVYAVPGNHDVTATLVGGFTVGGTRMRDPRMEQFLKDSNITLLLDDTVMIADNSISLTGRIDGEETGDGKERKSLDELTDGLDFSKSVFFINHEPVELNDYADKGIDILFSGHTHAGQTFPLTLSMPFAWKNPAGCLKIGNMYSLVTSGIGVYGPFMRTFADPEIMNIHIHFE